MSLPSSPVTMSLLTLHRKYKELWPRKLEECSKTVVMRGLVALCAEGSFCEVCQCPGSCIIRLLTKGCSSTFCFWRVTCGEWKTETEWQKQMTEWPERNSRAVPVVLCVANPHWLLFKHCQNASSLKDCCSSEHKHRISCSSGCTPVTNRSAHAHAFMSACELSSRGPNSKLCLWNKSN